jgi:outer membrane protein
MKRYLSLSLVGISTLLASVCFAGSAADVPLVTNQTNDTNELAQGPWLIRTRAIVVDPRASSSTIKPDLGGQADDISTEATVEFDVNYFFTKNISTELILATTKHNVEARNTVLGDVNLGTVNLLPPTLTALYHFFPESRISPYIGAGINYTDFYGVNPGSVATSVDYKNSIGPALQAGFDVAIDNHWSLNADVKKIYINSDVSVETGGLLPTQKTSVDINPLVFGVGFGYRFS